MEPSNRQKLVLAALGDLRLSRAGTFISLPTSKKACELLILLALAQGEWQSREKLARLLWPNTEEQANRMTSFRQQLKSLRRALGNDAERIREAERALCIAPEEIELDALTFRALVAPQNHPDRVARLTRALDMYSGPLFPHSDARPVLQLRRELQQLFLNGLEELAQRQMQAGDTTGAATLLRRALKTDPCRESAFCLLLPLLANDPAEATAAFDRFRDARVRARHWPPESDTLALYKQLLAAYEQRRAAAKHPEAPITPFARLMRLPRALTSLIGREKELAIIGDALLTSPLVTISGSGGTGKTRLALEVIAHNELLYRDGVVFVSFSGLAAGAALDVVVEQVLSTLEVSGCDDMSALHAVTMFLAPRNLLLVLDNCEQITSSCAALSAHLLERCPHLHLLVTSRERLSLANEQVIALSGLSLPPQDPDLTPQEARQAEAVQLFEARTSACRVGFQVEAANAQTVTHICRLLDGLPLAIELAAGAAGSTALNDLAHALSEDFSFLVGSNPMRPERYHSLQAMIAWSEQLLPPEEQMLFRRLAIFIGGWSLTAATVIGEPQLSLGHTLSLLNRLHDKSLIEFAEHEGHGRYRMLEIVRQYALQRLEKSGEYGAIAAAHLEFFVRQAEEEAEALKTGDQPAVLRGLALNADNMRAALEYALTAGEIEKALRFASALARYWYVKGMHQEGRLWLDRVLQISADAAPAQRRDALHAAATVLTMCADYGRAETLWQECLAIGRAIGDERGAAIAQGNLAHVALTQERYAEARELLEICLTYMRRSENLRGIAQTLSNLAIAARGEQDYSRACDLYKESIALFRQLNEAYMTVRGLNNLADTLIFLQDYPGTRTALEEAVTISRELDNQRTLAHCLSNYAALAIHEEQYERAALLLGAEEALRARIDFPLSIQAQLQYQGYQQIARDRLGESAFTMRRNAGARISILDIYRYLAEDY